MATPTKTIRLRPKLRAEIERIARRSRRSFSDVAQTLLDEALRAQACPGIYFADEPAGRVAKVAGMGLGVWEIIRDYHSSGVVNALMKVAARYPTGLGEYDVLYL